MNSSAFLASPHGYGKVSKTTSMDNARSYQQPKGPDKPAIPYMRFHKKVFESVRTNYPDLKVWELSKIIGQMWRDLDDNERQPYCDEYESEKLVYNEALKAYHNSSAYQVWISSLKSKACTQHDEPEAPRRRDRRSANNHSNHPIKTESRIQLQSYEQDLEDDTEYVHIKQTSASRYYRNNFLINEILSGTVMPDVRNFVPESRLHVLQKQVESLDVHKRKIDEELVQLEVNYQAKRQAILEDGQRFNQELGSRFPSGPVVDELGYRQMVDRAVEQLRRELLPQPRPVVPVELPQHHQPPSPKVAPAPSNASNCDSDETDIDESSAYP